MFLGPPPTRQTHFFFYLNPLPIRPRTQFLDQFIQIDNAAQKFAIDMFIHAVSVASQERQFADYR